TIVFFTIGLSSTGGGSVGLLQLTAVKSNGSNIITNSFVNEFKDIIASYLVFGNKHYFLT
ncbi:MAG: hypothetical protein Q8N03_05905, partial [Ignavibacteria bacterium]|nr:hypothetical protein [Ignavibacteria bacterium]